MRTLYVECNMGAAGDMLNAALLEICPNPKIYFKTMNSLGIDGLEVSAVPCEKCGIMGKQMVIKIHDAEEEPEDVPLGGITQEVPAHGGHIHGHLEHHHSPESPHIHEHAHSHAHAHFTVKDVIGRIKALPIPEKVKQDACAVYGIIAQAESEAHGREVEAVHFHEVGAIDAIADVVGVCLLMDMIAPDRVVVSPIHVGSGQVKTDHGVLPVPVPAVVNILKGVPTYCGEIRKELCTPTGAALLKYFADSFSYMPPMEVEKTGYGMGKRDFAAANCVRVFLGRDAALTDGPNGTVVKLECNLDDMTPEGIGSVIARLFEEGALDAFSAPIYMKKNRPAALLSCLCRPEDADRLAVFLLRETTTFGVRRAIYDRYMLERSFAPIETAYGAVTVKRGRGYGVEKAKPEYEDIVRCAGKAGVSFETAYRAALREL